ncbi:self-incompatibility protein S1-like [Cornus florida]|uniref:self-incompatibility protein S1-like n=1 Tax=Cornus florida TaxID=4283 RepID=UPI0028A0A6F7|nr:self-incompatibility protein S1-like [Cornus florida]
MGQMSLCSCVSSSIAVNESGPKVVSMLLLNQLVPATNSPSMVDDILLLSLCDPVHVLAHNVHASIKNRLGSGKIMTVHCQSKDNDLGQQTVGDGSEFGWDFSPNVWGTTLFYCNMEWENVREYQFDAYSFTRDYVRCETECSWLISMEGMYGLNGKTGLWEFIYHWPN